MSLYNKILPFSENLVSIRKLEGYLSFDLKLPTKWGIPKSIVDEGQLVPYETNEENTKGFSFVCGFNDKEIEDTLLRINKTIKLNKDKEIKERLFKETVERLKQTFEKNDLEKLKNLYFDFEQEQTILDESENGQISDDVELA